ncbi:alpha-1,3-glucan synthase Mok13 [Schizosaccharomyces japonicus yFS275]|uniref:alpha-1,3-glucan synthase n=1 Tax=Schizosaccharomyces japonicus (strain yFS275 / FY16936) TaxID=402676 RepID=B6K656_SCHJY|nr:alpha-1,3-glucan synthase Mok13 [Schizosaccharomyces japonicus yFS275]EEB09010.2 alpha-1,3-glucan synthase Mok13 [Schizosaccharomyces japonicus yFS275]
MFYLLLCIIQLLNLSAAARFTEDEKLWNLNQNTSATHPLEYWGTWENHRFHPSPNDWRFPFYTVILDKWKDGDPTNNEANGTLFEYDMYETGFRNGGDIVGLRLSLDYLESLGIKGIYIAGTPFVNQPWGADQYSPLDYTILDHHSGTIEQWRETIEDIHKRGLYLVLDLTVSTLGDLVGFKKYLNTTTPFSLFEHEAVWKNKYHYADWTFTNKYDANCELPRFWGEDGGPVVIDYKGCYDSDFDHYGDTEAFGTHPDWQRQLSKFASVQDRLREWKPEVAAKLKHFACLIISMLDVDGFRIDKATQITVDFLASWSSSVRSCAKRFNKTNFFIPGEVTGSSSYGSIYYGRGRQPDQRPPSFENALKLVGNETFFFLRGQHDNALDASAFHYSLYRAITRFLRMDGDLQVRFDVPVEFTQGWNKIVIYEDQINPNTGTFDPRHLYGVTNHDVFRWPAIANGAEKLILGTMVTFFLFPGIPSIYYGDEQGMYVLDNTAKNYIYGRQAMPSAMAWKLHGCYSLGSEQYPTFPISKASHGCQDEWNTLDHFDFAKEELQIFKQFSAIRNYYVSLKDGWKLKLLGNWTHKELYEHSWNVSTEIGVWSVVRGFLPGIQNFTISQYEDSRTSDVWILYTNQNSSVTLDRSCDSEDAVLAPFESGITVKDLIFPFEEFKLLTSKKRISKNGRSYGCLPKVRLPAWGYRLFVPKSQFTRFAPYITSFSPAHDSRLINYNSTVSLTVSFNEPMDCEMLTKRMSFKSKTLYSTVLHVDESSVVCSNVTIKPNLNLTGLSTTKFTWSGRLYNVQDGLHQVTIPRVFNSDHSLLSDTNYNLMFRIGSPDNPMVFNAANRSSDILTKDGNSFFINHKASGADYYRYSVDYGLHWSNWTLYDGRPTNCTDALTNLTKSWSGHYVKVQYWSEMASSANHMQEGGLSQYGTFPHLYLNGPYNEWGFDSGISNEIPLSKDSPGEKLLSREYMAQSEISTVLKRLPPSELDETVTWIKKPPPTGYLSWEIILNDYTREYHLQPRGSTLVSFIIYFLFFIAPLVTALVAVFSFKNFFYQVKFNKGKKNKRSPLLHLTKRHKTEELTDSLDVSNLRNVGNLSDEKRKVVLIATLEYDIEDWAIKIKIGGLGVMSQLMGKHLTHVDLIWVVPCVGDIVYPFEHEESPLEVTVLDQVYLIRVYSHRLRNIKYILLEAPVFRRQTSNEPYPARMDDLSSAIFYSAWNQCIAGIIKRYPIDLYHINDYHGALAPCYLLPSVIPCALSLHNAEFQGLWPLRTPEEKAEVCSVYNISSRICSKYVQFGNVFNLLHAGVSYLRIHQKGFGVVGVSNKYGKRSRARYPIFWGLKKIGKLPNPDPTDTAALADESHVDAEITIDAEAEALKKVHKRQAQEWTHLDVNDDTNLLVFVGRWSMQKGIDLIADLAPTLLEEYNVQLITIGPVIDLYGKFAAKKLEFLMNRYPGRVFSKPEFTQLPPYIFSGADFVLIPSRDEPFGLVAVEFGRKGALGIGARVGGLGQMPGWWYTVESNATSHLLRQFEQACRQALSSSPNVRAKLRAKSARQRFPVLEWVSKLDRLMNGCIRLSKKCQKQGSTPLKRSTEKSKPTSGNSDITQTLREDLISESENPMEPISESVQVNEQKECTSSLIRKGSLGSCSGPGHSLVTLSKPDPLKAIEEEVILDNQQDVHESGGPRCMDPDGIYQASVVLGMSQNELGNSGSELQEVDDANSILEPPNRGVLASYRDDDSSEFSTTDNLPSYCPSEAERPSEVADAQVTIYRAQPTSPPRDFSSNLHNDSQLSLASVISLSGNKEFALSRTDLDFTDSKGRALEYFSTFLEGLTPKTSKEELCIETFLTKMKKEWYDGLRNLKFGLQKPNKLIKKEDEALLQNNYSAFSFSHVNCEKDDQAEGANQSKNSLPTVGIKGNIRIKRFMQRRLGEWPVYTLFLSLGQILAATSFQLTLLTGSAGQSSTQLYIIGGRRCRYIAIWFILFILCAYRHFIPNTLCKTAQLCLTYAASCVYGMASASGSLYFSLNFGDEGNTGVLSWISRACVVQGLQQVWAACLWYWGSYVDHSIQKEHLFSYDMYPTGMVAAIAWPLAIMMIVVGILLVLGLPDFYWEIPGKIPAFYISLLRRKLVLWFIVATVLQNYWLSTLYGRSWKYLWGSVAVDSWKILLMASIFFVFVWTLMLSLLGLKSTTHSWLLPIFGVGLGSPRWLQMMWGTSNIGLYLPWAGDFGPFAGRLLWLWLGVLDAIQGIGVGMILLQTLTRQHIATTLMTGQIIGTVASLLARATAPNRLGPGPVFIDLTAWDFKDGGQVFANVPFWICLVSQLVVSGGYLLFFRRENLSRP